MTTELINPQTDDIDLYGRWYQVAKERGVNTIAMLSICNVKDHTIKEWLLFDHQHMDGLGALYYWFKQKGMPVEAPPQGVHVSPPLRLYPRLLRLSIKSIEEGAYPWRERNEDAPNLEPKDFEWRGFSQEETQAISQRAKEAGSGLNAYLLSVINRVVLKELAKPEAQSRWLFPVNMRGFMNVKNPIHNQSSFINIETSHKTTNIDIHQSIKKSLKSFEHFATVWGYRIGQLAGLRGMRYLSKKSADKHYCFGTFSSLGHLPDVFNIPSDRFLGENEAILGCPPGTKNYPISAATNITKGHLTLTFKIHPYILKDQSRVQTIFETICSEL